ncbi:unnamed protein product, partial [marine sediment metagenome]
MVISSFFLSNPTEIISPFVIEAFIITSNIGSRQLKDFGHGIGFETNSRKETRDELTKSIIQKALKKT